MEKILNGGWKFEAAKWKLEIGNWKARTVRCCLIALAWGIIQLLTSNFQLQAQTTPEEQETSITPYLIAAAENNPGLKALFNEYLAALEEVKQEGVLPDPQLSFGYFIQPIETRVGAQRATFSLSQMFPWFGTLDAHQRVAAEKAKARLEAFEEAKAALFRELRTTYNDMYYLERALEISQENLQLLESLKSLSEVYFESGKQGFSAVLQVEMEEQELQNRLADLQDNRQPLLSKFEQLLNRELEEPVDFPDSLAEETLSLEKEILFDSILAANPRMEQLRYEAKSFEEQQDVARKMGAPSIMLGMTYTNVAPRTNVEPAMVASDNGKDVFIFPQLGIRLPIYRKKYEAMQKAAALRQEATAYRMEKLENELLTELEGLFRDYREAERNIALYQRLTRIARQSLDLLQTELSTGQNDLFEVIRMEKQLLSYRLELEKARTAKNNTVYKINYLMGDNDEQDK